MSWILDFFGPFNLSLEHQKAPNVIDKLITAVVTSFNEMEKDKLNDVFLSLQNCLITVMKVNGGNNYKLLHMGKARLARLFRSSSCKSTLSCRHIARYFGRYSSHVDHWGEKVMQIHINEL